MNKKFLIVLVCAAFIGAASAAPDLEAYGRLPAFELMRLSPSGQRFAYVTVIGENRKLTVSDLTGKALAAADVGLFKIRDVQWADEDHVLLNWSSTVDAPHLMVQAYELHSVANFGLSDQKVSVIFGSTPGVLRTVFGEFGTARTNGHLYGYFGGITLERNNHGEFNLDHGYSDLYRVDLDTSATSLEAHGGKEPHCWVITPDGDVVAHSEYEQRDGKWRLYRGKNRGDALLEVTAPLAEIRLVGAGRTPGTVLVTNQTGIRNTVEEISVADGKREELFKSDPVETFLHDPDTGLLIGATLRDQSSAIFFDRKQQSGFDSTRKAFPGKQIQLASFSHNLDRLIVKTEGGNDSGSLWMVDLVSKEAQPIGQAYPEIPPTEVGFTKWVKYAAADGLQIEGVLTLPPARKPEKLPLVVMPHGGPIGVRDAPGFDWWAQAYASAGYAVFQPNYRGSSGYGKDFLQAGFGQWGRKMQTDLSDGITALAQQGIVDPKRVCIVGGSYGGYAALAGVTLQHGLYRCAVSVGGPSDMSSFFDWQTERHGDNNNYTRYWRAVTGADKEGNEAMEVISPKRFAKQADAPILLIHGKDDTVVPVEQSDAMADALKSAGKPVDLVIMDGEDHWLSRQATRMTMLKAAVAFVKRHNPAD